MTDKNKPCSNCPYRKDAPRELWHRSEFENLLQQDADPMNGEMFACHKERNVPAVEREVCRGWLLDQKKRNIPSIRLRLALIRNARVQEIYEQVTADGLELFETIDEMCRANNVQPEEVS